MDWSVLSSEPIFVSGDHGYHTFRIPALVGTLGGVLLAFAEGRVERSSDTGRIHLLLRRSTNGGLTWGPLIKVWEDGANTCGNPSPVIDPATGDVVLLATWNLGSDHETEIMEGTSEDSRRVYVLRSRDEGLTWSEPQEITQLVKKPSWTWYATGPGAGIGLRRGTFADRLVIPCDHKVSGTQDCHSHVILSDDGGKTWRLGGIAEEGTNECEVAELADGRLLLNMRNSDKAEWMRKVAWSRDGGETWEGQRNQEELIEPICQASLRRYSWPSEDRPGVLLFSNPANRRTPEDRGRQSLTVRASLDEGESWPYSLVVHPGPAAYSDLEVLPGGGGGVGLLYEGGEKAYRESIRFARIGIGTSEK